MGRTDNGAVWPAAVASGALIAQIVAGKATRDTLFLSHFGLELLPAAMIGAALVSSAAVLLVARALSRHGPARVVPSMFGLGAVLFLGEWWLAVHDERAAAIAVYAHTALFGAAAVSAFWSLVNERFDPHAAKQLVGRIASGGTIGGVVGGLVAWRASAHLTVPAMLVLLSAMNAVGLWGALRAAPSDARPSGAGAEVATSDGRRAFAETPYLRDLALLVLSGAVASALLDWLLSARATEVFGKGPRLLGFFALFNMGVGLFSFVAQTTLTRRVLEHRGLGTTVKTLPASVAVGVAVALVAPWFAGIVVLRGLEAVARGSLYRSAYELFYTPLPPAMKRATKTIVDVGVDRVGTLLGSGALLAIAHLPSPLATKIVLLSAVALAATSWWVASRLQDGYVAALAESLRSGAVSLDDDGGDFTTKKTLAETTALIDRQKLLARIDELQKERESRITLGTSGVIEPVETRDPVLVKATALASGEVAEIKRVLAKPIPPKLAPHVVPLLANDAVVRDAVRALRKIAPRSTGLLLDHLLDPDVDVRVRRRLPRVLKVCRSERAIRGLFLALADPAFEVRVQVGLALAHLDGDVARHLDRDAVAAAVLRELEEGRVGWPDRARGLSHVFTVLGLVLDREPLSIAYRALRAEDRALRGTAVEYLDVVLDARVRRALGPLLGAAEPPPAPRERDRRELAAELLRSGASLPRVR